MPLHPLVIAPVWVLGKCWRAFPVAWIAWQGQSTLGSGSP